MERDLTQLLPFLESRVRGQDAALRAVASAIVRAELGFSKPRRPRSVLLLLGPTGVGKTETALALAEFLFGSRQALERFDMAEYQGPEALGRFLGECKSSQGLFGDALDRQPDGGLLLFDEIEKADRDFVKTFLGILDAARVTLTTGQTRELEPYYFFFTSNLGGASAAAMTDPSPSAVERIILQAVQQHFSPEMLTRFENKIVFHKLDYATQAAIAESILAKELAHIGQALGRRMSHPPSIDYDRATLNYLIREGYTAKLGARPMRNTIERLVGDAVAQWALAANGSANDTASKRLTVEDQKLTLTTP